MAYPAPWTLTGRGIILPYWLNKDWMAEHFPGYSGRLGVAMWVDYHTSPVGPYREWLFIPGKRKNTRGKHYSVSHIVVDSESSMRSGRENWGMPKNLASFHWQQEQRKYNLSLSYQDSKLSLKGKSRLPSIPIYSGLLPFSLYQNLNATAFWTRPVAKGWGQWLQVESCEFKGASLPDLSEQRLLGAFAIPRFEMTFPVAEILVS